MKTVKTKLSGYALLLVLMAMSVVIISVTVGALVTGRAQASVKRAQLLQRSYIADQRVKNLLVAAAADQFEVAPTPTTSDLAVTIANAVASLQGNGSWGIVSQPVDSSYGQIAAFPKTGTPHPLSDVSAIEDFMSPDIYRLLGGSSAEWSAIGAYHFKRYDYQTKEVEMQVRTISFPILRPPQFGPPAVQNRIPYWKPSDLRTTEHEYSSLSDSYSVGPKIDEDVSLLTRFSSVSLGLDGDEADASILPWSFRARAEVFVYAPGYIFSEAGMRAYVAYCGVTHTYPLDADLANAPYSVPALNGLTRDSVGPQSVQIDVSGLGHSRRVVGGVTYDENRSAVVLSAETGGGNIVLSDSGGTTTPIVIIVMGSYDQTKAPISVTVAQSISRPTILILSHVHLSNQPGATRINGAIYMDGDVNFSAADFFHISSLVYYGRTAVSNGLDQITADLLIPSEIEAWAPRAVLAAIKVL